MNKSITLFTIDFPYGNQEVFLENELSFLSDSFDSINIVPLFPKKTIRDVHFLNITVFPPILNKRKLYFTALLTTLFYKAFFSCLVSTGLTVQKIWKSFKQAIIITNTKVYLDKHNELFSSDIWYFYWGTNTVNVLPFLTEFPKTIARLHGFDLYEEDTFERPPQVLRTKVFGALDSIHVITENGINYLRKKYPEFKSKYILSRLGVSDRGLAKPSDDGIFRLMTCSNIYKIKRIDLLAKALIGIQSINIEWTHFGDGDEKLERKLFKITDDFSPNITFNYKGRVPNSEVIKHFQKQPVDLFVNVSLSEGLPVSIMEAISFGVPVLATDCGGISELINTNNGAIIPVEISPEDLTSRIIGMVTQYAGDKRIAARSSWAENVNSEMNYKKFYQFVKNMK